MTKLIRDFTVLKNFEDIFHIVRLMVIVSLRRYRYMNLGAQHYL